MPKIPCHAQIMLEIFTYTTYTMPYHLTSESYKEFMNQ